MKMTSMLGGLTLTLLLFGSSSCAKKPPVDAEVAVLETSYGRIVIELIPGIAPKFVENFKELTREGFYDGTRFHRIVSNKNKRVAIQGGDPNTINGDPATWGQGQPGQKTVPGELSTMSHERGIVSAAHRPKDIDSATSQFFICVVAEPSFDRQYSVFGHVTEGMNVVDAIARAPIIPKTERPLDPVVINHAYIIRRDELK